MMYEAKRTRGMERKEEKSSGKLLGRRVKNQIHLFNGLTSTALSLFFSVDSIMCCPNRTLSKLRVLGKSVVELLCVFD